MVARYQESRWGDDMNSFVKSILPRVYLKISVLSRKEVCQESRSDDEDRYRRRPVLCSHWTALQSKWTSLSLIQEWEYDSPVPCFVVVALMKASHELQSPSPFFTQLRTPFFQEFHHHELVSFHEMNWRMRCPYSSFQMKIERLRKLGNQCYLLDLCNLGHLLCWERRRVPSRIDSVVIIQRNQ